MKRNEVSHALWSVWHFLGDIVMFPILVLAVMIAAMRGK